MPRSPKLLMLSVGVLQVGSGLHGTTYLSYAGFFFRDRFALPLAEVSILVSAAFLLFGLAQFLTCLFLDLGVRLAGRRAMLLRAPVIYVAGWLLMTFGPSPPLAALGGGLIGLGAATLPLVLAIVAEHTDKRRSGLAAGLVSGLQLAGQLLAVAIGWLFVRQGHVTLLFQGMAAMWVLVALVLFFALEREATTEPPADGVDGSGLARLIVARFDASLRETRRMLADPETRALKALMAISGVAPPLAGTYIPVYLISLVRDPRLSAGYIAASTALGVALGALSAPAIGLAADRRRDAPQLMLGTLTLLAATLVGVGRVGDAPVVCLLAVVATVGAQWLTTLQSAVQLTLAREAGTTTFFLANQLPFFAGLPVGLLMAIGVIQVTGSVANALLLVGALFALGAAIWGRHLLKAVGRPQVRLAQ